MAGRKMAKSAGNFQRVTELADEGIDPLAFRYLALTVALRPQAQLLRRLIAGRGVGARVAARPPARARVRRRPTVPGQRPCRSSPVSRPRARGARGGRGRAWPDAERRTIADSDFVVGDRAHAPAAPLSPAGRALHDRFVSADRRRPRPARGARHRPRDAPGRPARDERRWLVLDADVVLGLDLHATWRDAPAGEAGRAEAADDLSAEAAALLRRRDAARAQRDFEAADALRAELGSLGIEPIDRPGAPSTWRRLPPAGHD